MAEGETKKNVIVAIDGSEHAERAFDFYLEHLRGPDDHLLLVHSAEPPHINSQQAMYMSGEMWDQMLERERVRVKAMEETYAEKMRSAKVAGTIKAVFSGRPGQTVVEMANEEKATLIVMGTRGMGTVRRSIMGSVSDYVVHHAHCPVCVCRH